MKICHSCGTEVVDKDLVCPVCGATVVKNAGDFSLKKAEPEKKKKRNPMGQTMSTGSGLTDILKGDDSGFLTDEENFNGGSIPTSYSKAEYDELRRKKLRKSRAKLAFFIVALIAVGFFAWRMYAAYHDNIRGTDSYENVFKEYIESFTTSNRDEFDNLMPKYMDGVHGFTEKHYDANEGEDIFESEILEVSHLNAGELVLLQDDIKLESARTAVIEDGVTAKVAIRKNTKKDSGALIAVYDECEFTFVKIKGRWYFEIITSEVPFE